MTAFRKASGGGNAGTNARAFYTLALLHCKTCVISDVLYKHFLLILVAISILCIALSSQFCVSNANDLLIAFVTQGKLRSSAVLDIVPLALKDCCW